MVHAKGENYYFCKINYSDKSTWMELLDEKISKQVKRRRELLPIWIKVFIWIFMLGGFLVPFILGAGLFGGIFLISIYGLETVFPISFLGFLIMGIFAMKGVVSYGLWTEKDWAIKLAIFDASIGLLICVFMVIGGFLLYDSDTYNVNIRLEPLLLVPYLLKMRKIKPKWES